MNLTKFYIFLPYLLIVSAFGFYIGAGLRIEHVLLYPSAALFLLVAFTKRRNIIAGSFLVFGLWLFSVLIMTFATIGNYEEQTAITKIFADAESFIQPLAVMVLFLFVPFLSNQEDMSGKLQKASILLMFMLFLNTMFSVVSIFIDTTRIGNLFWSSGGEVTVASLAMTNGRYSGIFNQPMEAGIMYSIGLLAWLYIVEKRGNFDLILIFLLLSMIAGGTLTVSKVFLFGGLFLFGIGVMLSKSIRRKFFKLMFWFSIFGYAAYHFLLKDWLGLDYLLRFFGSTENIIRLITAGRYGGSNAQQANYFKEVWETSPFYGNGFGVTPIYDSGFFSFFATGGIISLTTYILLLLFFFVLGLKFLLRNGFNSETKLFIGLIILIAGASIGSPILTLNRVSLVLWIFIGLLLQVFYMENKTGFTKEG